MRFFWSIAVRNNLAVLLGAIFTTIFVFVSTPSEAASCKVSAINSASLTPITTGYNLNSTTQTVFPATLTLGVTLSGGGGGSANACDFAFQISGTLKLTPTGTMPYAIASDSAGATTISNSSSQNYLTVPAASISATIVQTVYVVVPKGVYAYGSYTDTGATVSAYESNTQHSKVAGPHTISVTLNYQNASCTINGTSNATATALDFSNGSSISTVAKTATFSSVNCNAATHIDITSSKNGAYNGSATTASVSGGYANFFNYTAVATFENATTKLTTNSASGGSSSSVTIPGTTPSSGAASGSMTVVVTPAVNSKVTAGTYSDTLTVTLTAK